MTRPSPVPEAMERLRVSGERELLGFVNEVRAKSNKELLSVLPSVDGFRKDSVNSLPTRKRAMLANFLKKGGGSLANKSRADGAYFYFWRSWAEEHLADVEGLDEALDAIEKDGLASEEVDAAVEQLFKTLQEQSFLNRCSAESIFRLLHFSPFAISDNVERLASGAKPQVAVEKDRALSALPDRLKSDEELLEGLQQRVDQLADEVSRLSSGLVERPEESPSVTQEALSETNERVSELSRQWQALEERQQEAARAEDPSARLIALEGGVADLEALWAEMDDRAKSAASELGHRLDALDVLPDLPIQHFDDWLGWEDTIDVWMQRAMRSYGSRLQPSGVDADHLQIYAPDEGRRLSRASWAPAQDVDLAGVQQRLCRTSADKAELYNRPYFLGEFVREEGSVRLLRSARLAHDHARRLRFAFDTALGVPRRLKSSRVGDLVYLTVANDLPPQEARVLALGWNTSEKVSPAIQRLAFPRRAMSFVAHAFSRLGVTIEGGDE